MHWLNEPPVWTESDAGLTVFTAPKTDFWRVTHYGFIRDTGHFYYDTVDTDFSLEVTIRGQYDDLYDQAGVMLRVNDRHWIKTGIEYVNGMQYLSAVVTHDYSDWSVLPLPHAPEVLQLRVERRKEAIELFYFQDDVGYAMFRLTYLPCDRLQVGLMCASPDGDGFEVSFEDYSLKLM